MDNLDFAVENGYITENEAKVVDLLRAPAKKKPARAKPARKVVTPVIDGKKYPKENVISVTPEQEKRIAKLLGHKGRVGKDGIKHFPPVSNSDAGVAETKATGGAGNTGNTSTGAGPSSGNNGEGGGGRDDSGSGSQNGSQGSQGSNGGATSRDDGARDTVGANAPAGGQPASGNGGLGGGGRGQTTGNPAAPSSPGSQSRDDGMRAPVGANKPTGTVSGPGKQDLPSTTINKTPGPQGLIGPADQTVNKGITSPANVTFIDKNPEGPVPVDEDLITPVTQAERNLMNKVKQPTTYARLDSPSSLETLGSAGSIFDTPLADRPGTYDNSELTNIVGGNQPQRANQPTREAYADNIASDPTAGQINNSLASLAGPPPQKIADRMGQVGGMGGPRGSLTNPPSPDAVTAARDAILGPAGTLTGPYDVKAPVAQPAGTLTKPYEPAKPVAVAAGTLTTPYEKEIAIPGIEPAPLTGSPATRPQMPTYGTGPLQDVDPVASLPARPGQTTPPGWGVPDVPQMKADQTVEKGITLPQNVTFIDKTGPASSLAALEQANAIPGVQPAIAAGTLTQPYNVATVPDSPLSPLATAKPRALGLDGYQGPQAPSNQAIAAGTLTGPYNTPANDNDSELGSLSNSTIPDQNMPNTSTIADQDLPGGLPSTPRGPTLGQGGQGGTTAQPAGNTTPPAPVTPPPPVVEQIDPYAGIMPWDRIAYDAIKKSYEASGQTYTPANFIASFYNVKQAA